MKVALLLTLPFLLFAFFTNLPLAFSEQVLDISGKPIFPGGTYFIVPANSGPTGGGLILAQTENSNCPVTVLQAFPEFFRGHPVKFTIPGISPGIILTGTPLEIEFTIKPGCASSSKWSVFVDEVIQKACVGIGGAEDHPGQSMPNGTFNIQRSESGYKLAFCVTGSPVCLDIGKFNANNGESGSRLNLTEHEPFEIVFIDASEFDAVIKSVA